MADFDPVSFSGGFGAGEQQGRQDGMARAKRAEEALRLEADHNMNIGDGLVKMLQMKQQTQNHVQNLTNQNQQLANQNQALTQKVDFLETEINKRWIPYGVTLKASLVARKIQRETLIEELKKANPENAEKIIQDAETQVNIDYQAQTKGDSLVSLIKETTKESQDERLS